MIALLFFHVCCLLCIILCYCYYIITSLSHKLINKLILSRCLYGHIILKVPCTLYLSHNCRLGFDVFTSLHPDPRLLGYHHGRRHDTSPLLTVMCDTLWVSKVEACPFLDVTGQSFLGLPVFRLPSTKPCRMVLLSPVLLVTWPYHFSFQDFTVSS